LSRFAAAAAKQLIKPYNTSHVALTNLLQIFIPSVIYHIELYLLFLLTYLQRYLYHVTAKWTFRVRVLPAICLITQGGGIPLRILPKDTSKLASLISTMSFWGWTTAF